MLTKKYRPSSRTKLYFDEWIGTLNFTESIREKLIALHGEKMD